MKFMEENKIKIRRFDKVLRAIFYALGIGGCVLFLIRALFTTALDLAFLNLGISIVSVGVGIWGGEAAYQKIHSPLVITPPLSTEIIIRRERGLMVLYYKRWGRYRRWDIREGNDAALFKNEYRTAYENRNVRPPKHSEYEVLYEGSLKPKAISDPVESW